MSLLSVEPHHEKTCFVSYAKNKDADQPAHPLSLISVFVGRCLDSIIPTHIQNFKAVASFFS